MFGHRSQNLKVVPLGAAVIRPTVIPPRMEVNCRGCAGCCLDWRSLCADETIESEGRRVGRTAAAESADDADRTSPARVPLGGSYNFVALSRDEVRTFVDQGAAAALTVRFWAVEDEREGIEIGGRQIAAVAGRPVFFVGRRKPPKPVAPFDREEPAWLPTCVFLDPTTLQCRIHDDECFPDECAGYPGQPLAHGVDTECERVEARFGGDRLLDDEHDDVDAGLFGPQALGGKLFCHPRPAALEGLLGRVATNDLEPADRADCLAIAAASSPGTVAISDYHYERAYEDALEALEGNRGDEGAWIGPAIDAWRRQFAEHGGEDGPDPNPNLARAVEERRGAPETPGWDALDE
jgi:hypothetical protein